MEQLHHWLHETTSLTGPAPLLGYVGAALEWRAVAVERMTWSPPADATPLWVAQQVGAVLAVMPGRPLVVGNRWAPWPRRWPSRSGALYRLSG